MYIEKVVLENFRGFAGNHEITLHPELTVFAGVNGSGKSAVLDAIGSLMSSTVSWIQGGTHSWFAGGEPRNIHAGADIADWGLIYREGGTGKHASLRLGAYLHPPSGTWKPPTTFGFLDQYRQATESILLPMLSYIHSSSTRLPVRHKERSADLTGRALAYRGAFDSEAHQFIDLETWYEQEENIENEEKNRLSSFRFELSTLKAVRGALMRGIGALHVCMLGKPGVLRQRGANPLLPAKGRLYLTKGDKQLFIDQLSDGERRMVFLILDTARRMVILNPQAEDPTMVPGILTVDEVELHLHPQWQRTVVACLRAAFPKLQLLLSTHSPIVLSSVPNHSVVLMGPGGVFGGKAQTYGRDPNSILTVEMDTPLHPDEVEQKLKDLDVALDTNLRKAKKMLKELELSWGQDHPELVRGRAYLGLMGG